MSLWHRYARRNAITLGVVAAIGVGAAVAVAGGSNKEPDSDGGSRGTATLPGESLPVDAMPSTPSTSSSSTSSSTTTSTSTSTTTTTIDPADVAHAYPVDPAVNSSFTPQAHANYQATDIFAGSGCGTALLAPVSGTIDEVTSNTWDPAVADPATRGGNAVSIRGDDGVRYYLAHFQAVDPAITPGARVVAGDFLGEMGETGRSSACHVHFGLSLPCDNGDWWVRRGVVWPDEYLASWRDGGNLSPLPELQAWFEQYPGACASPENIPYPIG
jgi:murein DD-endopeptidase MepM/ murein hydrolase activator NlpD